MLFLFRVIAFLLVSLLFIPTTAYPQAQVPFNEETPIPLRDQEKHPDKAELNLIQEPTDGERITIPTNTPTDTLRAWVSYWSKAYYAAVQEHQKHHKRDVIFAILFAVVVVLAILLFHRYRRKQQCRIKELLLQLEAQQQMQPQADATAQQQTQPQADATAQQQMQPQADATAQQQTQPQADAAPVRPQHTANAFLRQVNAAIVRQMPEGRLSTTTIAHELNLSPSQFRRRLAASTSLTPSNYILMVRMKKAKELLQEYPRYNIAEVAQMCGFADNAHFAHNFRRMFGMSPTKYINQH